MEQRDEVAWTCGWDFDVDHEHVTTYDRLRLERQAYDDYEGQYNRVED